MRVSLLSKLSIVILTYERHRYALRNMRFWSGTDVRVFVLDGSAKRIEVSEMEGLSPNIFYSHLPVSIWMRVAAAPAMIDSEYVAFLADDEFFIPSAVEACISELERDRELVACFGYPIGKHLSADLTVHSSVIEEAQMGYVRGRAGEVNQDHPIARMIAHMNPYAPSSLYAICRSQAWKQVVQFFGARQFSSGVAPELQFELSMSFLGKMRAINELMWLRSAENYPNVEEFELEFHAWFMDQSYTTEVADFLDDTAHNLAASGGQFDFNEIRSGLVTACAAYVECCKSKYVRARRNPNPRPARHFLSIFLKWLKSRSRKLISVLPGSLMTLLPYRLHFRPYADIARTLEAAGLKVDWAQLEAILREVQESHDYSPKTIRN